MSISSLVQEAKQAYQAGDHSLARRKLHQAVQIEPQHAKLWLTLAKLSQSAAEAERVLAQAITVHPQHPQIQSAFNKYSSQQKTTSSSPNIRIKRPFIYATLSLIGLFSLFIFGWVWYQGQQTTDKLPERLELVSQPDSELSSLPIVIPDQPEATATQRPLNNKLAVQQNLPRATWTVTPTPSPTPTPTPTVIPTFVSSTAYTQEIRPFGVGNNERWIDIDLSTQVLKAYEGDFLVFSTPISSGTAEHLTVTGQFRIWLKFESQTMDGRRLGYDYYIENVPYVMYFFEDYAIHGAYWHNNFGNPMSHGCVNVEPSDAGWLFNWASYGTMVNVHY
ncbi:MAG: L,D-transpeptidase family protein [Chloroflexota bacterium]